MTSRDNDERPASVTILHFPKKRGRPKVDRPKIDTGTPELIMKRLMGDTAETLDLCLEHGLISAQQHWCGIHLRWLYTLRYGAPGIRALDPTHLGGMENKPDDSQWRKLREREYQEVLAKLHEGGSAMLLLNICVYNERPRFLNRPHPGRGCPRNGQRIMEALKGGLDMLREHWGDAVPNL